jgi:hypothetical protein
MRLPVRIVNPARRSSAASRAVAVTSSGSLLSNAWRRAWPILETATRSTTGSFAVAPQEQQSKSSHTSTDFPLALTRNLFAHRKGREQRQR